MPLTIVKRDITTMHVEVIVNAANSALAPGGGVCGAIFAAAGYAEMECACRKLGGCPTGQAVMTEGFSLPAQAVIHTVGSIWRGGESGEAALLGSCYRTSLALAAEAGYRSIAFPLISAGIYGYPLKQALEIAVSSIQAFLSEHEMQVYLAVLEEKLIPLAESFLRRNGEEV